MILGCLFCCRLEKSEGKWFAVCQLTPADGTAVVEKEFRIDIVSPAGQPPISIRIRGTLSGQEPISR